jgi:hypothetical protein
MNCGACSNWTFKASPLKEHGFGLCSVEPDHGLRVARTTPARRACRNGRFERAAPATLAKRESALGEKVTAE